MQPSVKVTFWRSKTKKNAKNLVPVYLRVSYHYANFTKATGIWVRLQDLDIYEKDELQIREGKTDKLGIIRINPQLKEMVTRLHELMKIANNNELLFLNKNRTKAIKIQYVNRRLKEIASNYGLQIPMRDVSSHMFRKTLGHHVWAKNNYSEKSLILLSELFNHSTTKVTKIYLGINQQEIRDVYLSL